MSAQSQITRERIRAAWLFLSPMLIVLLLVAAWPLARTIFFGFTDANLSAIGDWRFIGFDNYLARYDGEWFGLLADGDWWLSVYNTLWFAAVSVTLETVLGMIVALVLHSAFAGRGLVRAAVLIPWAIPTIVSAKMWSWMLNDQFGVINAMLMALGIIDTPVAWTADPATAMWAVVMVDVWKTTPFMALLLLAGLQMIPVDCYEAARIDGVGAVRVFFKVTLPLIRPALIVAIVFRGLDALRVFDLIYVITANSRDTMSMSVYARQQLVDFQEVGIGSAASTLLFLVIAALTVITLMAGRVDLAGRRTR